MKRVVSAVLFLSVTFAAIGIEFWYGFDGDDSTVPWTGYLIGMPWWAVIGLPLAGGIVLSLHLWWEKRQRARQLLRRAREQEKTLLRTGEPPCP